MSLETLLREGAPEAHFDAGDVERRVRRTQVRRRRLLGGGALLGLVVAGLGAWALLRHDEPSSVTAGPPDTITVTVPFTEEALVGTRWVQVAPVSTAPAWIEFDAGQARVGDSCRTTDGAWDVEEGRLRLELVTVDAGELPQPADPDAPPLCPVDPRQLTQDPILRADGRLVLGGIELRRLDDLGRPGTREDLVGDWQTPDGEVEVSFDTTVRISACEFAFVFDDERGRMDSYNPACDFAPPASTISEAVLDGRPIVDGDDLWMITPNDIAHLVRTGQVAPAVDLSAGPWVPEDTTGFADAPRIELTSGGSFRAVGSCSFWSGPWELVDGRPVVDVRSHGAGWCAPEEEDGDALVAGAAVDGPLVLDGDRLMAGAVPFRQLGYDLAVSTEDELVGRWTNDDGGMVEFAEDTLTIDGTCATFGWERWRGGIRYRPIDTCLIGIDPRSAERLGLGSRPDLRLDGDDLYFLHDSGAIAVYHRQPGPDGGERMLYTAFGEMRVDPRWEVSEDGEWNQLGFEWDGALVRVDAVPEDVDVAAPRNARTANCGDYTVIVDGPDDAADILFDVLDCSD
jgi:hypothetical protein